MARHANGWIKLYRRALESDLGQNAYLWAIWTSLLSWATRIEQKRLIDGEQRVLPPGTVVFGITEIAKRWRISKSTASKWLGYLESSERITLERRKRGCIATICNWEEYQNDVRQVRTISEQSAETSRTLSEHCANPIGELKKERSEEVSAGAPKALTQEGILECVLIWGMTLTRFQIDKDPRLDEGSIARLIQRHGVEQTRLALMGAAYEEKTENFDPGKHVSIRRLLNKPDIFDKLANLGAQNKPKAREAQEWKL